MKKCLVICMVLFTFAVRGSEYEEIVEVLKYVETANQPHLIGDNGASWGVLQIQKSCVDDVNRYFGTNYTHNDMFNVACAEEVAILYMQMGAELYEKRTGRKATEEVLVRNHNGGAYKGYRYKQTLRYYKEYLKWKKRMKLQDDEKWITGYEGKYSITKYGVVISYFDMANIRELQPVDNGNGYLSVGLWDGEKHNRKYLHRLVAEAFIPNPENKSTVNHKDFEKWNNDVSNLEWSTRSENTKHGYDNGVIKLPKEPTLNAEDIDQMSRLYGSGWTQKQIAKEFGTTQPHVSRLLSGKRGSHVRKVIY